MKSKLIVIALAVIALMVMFVALSNAQQNNGPIIGPTRAGLYIISSSEYTKMELTTSAGFKTRGALATGLSYGIVKTKGNWMYRGESAATQATGSSIFVLVTPL